jgi:hypothetical protein
MLVRKVELPHTCRDVLRASCLTATLVPLQRPTYTVPKAPVPIISFSIRISNEGTDQSWMNPGELYSVRCSESAFKLRVANCRWMESSIPFWMAYGGDQAYGVKYGRPVNLHHGGF